MLKKILLITILFFLTSTSVSAATYFVAPNGNDSNSGTQQQPFKTIQKGVDKLSAGDTLNIRGGTYVEQVNITKGGTAQNPVTIQAYQNEQVTIDGEYRLPAGAQPNSPTKRALEDGTITRRSDGNYSLGNQIVLDSSVAPLVDISASNINFNKITITKSRGRGLRTYNSGFKVANIVMDKVIIKDVRWHGYTDYGINNTIKNCEITNSNNFATFSRDANLLNWGSAIGQSPHTNLTVDNCAIYKNWGEGIIASVGTIIQNSIFYNNYSAFTYIENA